MPERPIPPPLVMIIGAGRSGTSWVGRIFDSLPTTLYLHEPDLVVYDRKFPVVPPPSELDRFAPDADRLLDRLMEARPLKAVGARPIFKKPYRSGIFHYTRAALIYALRVSEEVIGRPVQRLRIPDMIDRPSRAPQTTVIKSVTALARLPYLARARPDMPIILVIRHPCAVASSLLRGMAKGKMPAPRVHDPQLALPPARRRGLDRKTADALSPLERTAWLWLIMHEWAMEQQPADSRIMTVRYEDVCEDPKGAARRLFDWCDLAWSAETDAFLDASLETSPSDATAPSYHSVIRNPAVAANRWRQELSPDQIETVYNIVGDSVPGRLFPR